MRGQLIPFPPFNPPKRSATFSRGAVTMCSGILFFALPIALIGSRFQEAYNMAMSRPGFWRIRSKQWERRSCVFFSAWFWRFVVILCYFDDFFIFFLLYKLLPEVKGVVFGWVCGEVNLRQTCFEVWSIPYMSQPQKARLEGFQKGTKSMWQGCKGYMWPAIFIDIVLFRSLF